MTIGIFLIKFIGWVLIIYGITQIIVDSFIFESIRLKVSRWKPMAGQLINCMLCTSVWISLLISVLLWSPTKAVYSSDLVNGELLATTKISMVRHDGTFTGLVAMVGYRSYICWAHIKARFCDMMIGSAVIWFLYVIEKRLTFFGKKDTIYKQE